MAHHVPDISKENRHLDDLASRLFMPMLAIGVIALAVAFVFGFLNIEIRERFYQGYLVNFMFFLAISLGALFFVILHHVTRAGWSTVLRRIAEGMATNLSWLFLLFIPIWISLFDGEHRLFRWASPELASDHLVHWKAPYLNPTFFSIRVVIYFAVWSLLAWFFFRNSVKQDETGDVQLTHRMQAFSAPAVPLFALTLTFAAVDWLLSIDPYFFSTIWGVYFFAGSACSFFAMAIVLIFLLHRQGRLRNAVTVEHTHDLGKLMFAFGMVFWAYIAFSQYMLIWYGNIPEETLWFQPRASGATVPVQSALHEEFIPGGWNWLSLFLLIGHFAAPFVLLISRVPKRRAPLLFAGALWMLFICWADLFWIVMPVFYPAGSQGETNPALSYIWLDILMLIGMGGIYFGLIIGRLRGLSLVPEKDPRLKESLAFENM